jgi:hypothetical protein
VSAKPNPSFQEILENYVNPGDGTNGENPSEGVYTEGSELGLGLLGQLYYIFGKDGLKVEKNAKRPFPYGRPKDRVKFTPSLQSEETTNEDTDESLDESSFEEAPQHLAQPILSRAMNASETKAHRFFVEQEFSVSNLKELNSAYRTLARRFHPDAHPSANDEQKRNLAQKFRYLKNQYTCLSDYFAEAHSSGV